MPEKSTPYEIVREALEEYAKRGSWELYPGPGFEPKEYRTWAGEYVNGYSLAREALAKANKAYQEATSDGDASCSTGADADSGLSERVPAGEDRNTGAVPMPDLRRSGCGEDEVDDRGVAIGDRAVQDLSRSGGGLAVVPQCLPHRCPVCFGKTHVPKGFYDPRIVVHVYEVEPCRSCGESGIVWG